MRPCIERSGRQQNHKSNKRCEARQSHSEAHSCHKSERNQILRAVSKNITTVSEVLANCSTAPCRSKTAVMWGHLVTWVSILTLVNTQCFVQEVSNTRSNGLKQLEIEVDLNEEVQGFLALTTLLRQETFLIRDRYIVTSPHDKTCIYLGNGIHLDKIETSYTKSVNLPLLTQPIILSPSKILLTTSEISTVVNKSEFSQLTLILGFEDKVNMAGHRNIVFLMEGSRKILTNYNVADRNICETTATVTNMAHRMIRLTSEMSEVWEKIKTANLLYGRVLKMDTFAKCLDLTEVAFHHLMVVSDDNLSFCRKGLMSRVARSISVGSFLLGEGSSILELQTSLHDTIANYNSNFKNMEILTIS